MFKHKLSSLRSINQGCGIKTVMLNHKFKSKLPTKALMGQLYSFFFFLKGGSYIQTFPIVSNFIFSSCIVYLSNVALKMDKNSLVKLALIP